MGRARVIVGSVLLLAVVLVTVTWGPDWADHSLGVFLFVVWLIFSKEYQDFIERTTAWLSQRSSRYRLAAVLNRVIPVFGHADLSLILAAAILLAVGASESLIAAVQDLAAKGLLSFDRQMAGFVHLQIYILGYLATLSFLLTCTAYGLHRGLRDRPTSFAKLLVAIPLGILLAILFLSVSYGGLVGGENLKIVTEKTPGSLPIGAEPTSPMTLVSVGITIWLGLAILTWVASLLGRLIMRLFLYAGTKMVPPETKQQVDNEEGRSEL